jgi:hypothetical protein
MNDSSAIGINFLIMMIWFVYLDHQIRKIKKRVEVMEKGKSMAAGATH